MSCVINMHNHVIPRERNICFYCKKYFAKFTNAVMSIGIISDLYQNSDNINLLA